MAVDAESAVAITMSQADLIRSGSSRDVIRTQTSRLMRHDDSRDHDQPKSFARSASPLGSKNRNFFDNSDIKELIAPLAVPQFDDAVHASLKSSFRWRSNTIRDGKIGESIKDNRLLMRDERSPGEFLLSRRLLGSPISSSKSQQGFSLLSNSPKVLGSPKSRSTTRQTATIHDTAFESIPRKSVALRASNVLCLSNDALLAPFPESSQSFVERKLSTDGKTSISYRSRSISRDLTNSTSTTESSTVKKKKRSKKTRSPSSKSPRRTTPQMHDGFESISQASAVITSQFPASTPHQEQRMWKGEKSRSIPRHIADTSSSVVSLYDTRRFERLHSQTHCGGDDKLSNHLTFSLSIGTEDDQSISLDEDSLAEIKAFMRGIKEAQREASGRHRSGKKKSSDSMDPTSRRSKSPTSNRKIHSEKPHPENRPSRPSRSPIPGRTAPNVQSCSNDAPSTRSSSLKLTRNVRSARSMSAGNYDMVSTESKWIELEAQLKQQPVLDRSRPRAVIPNPLVTVDARKQSSTSKSPPRMSKRLQDNRSKSPSTTRNESSLHWQDFAQLPSDVTQKAISLEMNNCMDSPFREYIAPLASDPCEREESRSLYFRIMNESDINSAEGKTMNTNELFAYLNDSSQFDEVSDSGHVGEDDDLGPPQTALSITELLSFLESDNRNDMPPRMSYIERDPKVSEANDVLDLAEMADILNHVATRHGDNEHIRWDVIGRMASDVGYEQFNVLLPFEYICIEPSDDESSVSSISLEGIDHTADFWNSGGSFPWEP